MDEEARVEVDVEKIMGEIRREIQMEEELKNLPSFEDIPIRGEEPRMEPEGTIDWPVLLESLYYINTSYDIPYYWSFSPAGIKTFLKRVVRKLLRCMLLPILEKLNQFNVHVVRCLNNFRYGTQELFARTDVQAEELARLKEALFVYENTQAEEKRRLSAQAEELACLKEMLSVHADAQAEEKRKLSAQAEELARLKETLSAYADAQAEEIALLKQELSAHADAQTEAVSLLKGELSAYMDAQAGETGLISSQITELQEMIRRLELLLEQRVPALRIDNMERHVGNLLQKVDNLDRQSDAFNASVAKMLLELRAQNEVPAHRKAESQEQAPAALGDSENKYTVLDYFKFQNDFRGTRSVIAERQKIYLPYFRNSAAPVLDVGCGRGEFLRIMKDNKIPAFGVDLYPEYVVEGELNGLDIRQGNGIDFLKGSDTQYGGIFSAQVIEHISFLELQEFCAAAFEKLLPGSYFVLETPNPTSLSMFTSSFYIDPTHKKPIHPLMLEYLLREIGFTEVQTIFTEASRAGAALPHIESDAIRNLNEVNEAIAKVSDLLYGSLDYAVIARK